MASLRDTQLAFADALLFDNPARIAMLIAGGVYSAIERVGIYRNNVRIGFLATMEATFPAVRALGGEDWFAQTARRYQQRHPSPAGNMHYVGKRFPDYLTAELTGSGYEYFADVAQLEWAYQEVLVAADAPSLDFASLANVPPDRYAELRFQLHPAVRIVRSRFPILSLWRAHRDTTNDTDLDAIDMNEGQAVLVMRRDTHVELRLLSHDEHRLFDALARNLTLQEALDDSEHALAALPRVAQLGALSGLSF
jgi:hypothetical protein